MAERGMTASVAAHAPVGRARVAGRSFSWRSAYLYGVGAGGMVATLLVLLGAETLLIVPVVLGSIVGILGFVALLMDRRALTPGTLLSIALLAGYCLGYSVLMASRQVLPSHPMLGWGPLNNPLETPASLLWATAVVFWAAAVCAVVGGLQRPALGHGSDPRFDSRSPTLALVLGLLIVGVAFATGEAGFTGTISRFGTVSPLGAIGALIAAPIALTALYSAATEPRARQRVTLFVIFVLAQAALVPMGRRMFAYSLLLAPAVWFAAQGKDRPAWGKLFRIAVFICVAIWLASSIFYAMREYGYEAAPRQRELGLSEQIVGSLSLLADRPADTTGMLGQSIGPRTGALMTYLALYGQRMSWESALHGRLALSAVVLAVPRVALTGKTDIVASAPSSEALTHPAMNVPLFDGSNSLLTEGYADFGLVGALAYPLLILALYSLFLMVVKPLMRLRPRVFIEIALLVSLLSVEQTMAGYLMTLRNLALVAIVLVLATSRRRIHGWTGGALRTHAIVNTDVSSQQHESE